MEKTIKEKNSLADIIALFRQICDGWGTTVVVVTHSREVAMVADRVVTVKDGAIV